MIALEGNQRLLYQWELNKRVIVDGASPGTKVEFSRKYDCKESALPTVAYAEGDHIYANIPNILLQSAGYIRVMVLPSAADTEHMPEVADFKIARREKPEDYAYTETPTETLDNKVNMFWGEENKGKALVIGDDGRVQAKEQPEAGGEVDPEAIENAVEKYLTENPPAGGGDKKWRIITKIELSPEISGYTITKDADGNSFLLRDFVIVISSLSNKHDRYTNVRANGVDVVRYHTPYLMGYPNVIYEINLQGDLYRTRVFSMNSNYKALASDPPGLYYIIREVNDALRNGISSVKWETKSGKPIEGETLTLYGRDY